MNEKERDEKNAYNNNWLLKNYERLKTNRNQFLEKSALPERVIRINDNRGKKKDLSTIIGQVKALYEIGKTQRQISELLAISTGSVCNFLKRE